LQALKAKERERRELGQTLVDQKQKRDDDAMIKAAEERKGNEIVLFVVIEIFVNMKDLIQLVIRLYYYLFGKL
jgi:hypothetical protein